MSTPINLQSAPNETYVTDLVDQTDPHRAQRESGDQHAARERPDPFDML